MKAEIWSIRYRNQQKRHRVSKPEVHTVLLEDIQLFIKNNQHFVVVSLDVICELLR